MINGEPFSIRNWVEEDQGNGWIFIASRPDQEDTLKPLITLWLDIVTSAILSIPTQCVVESGLLLMNYPF